MTAAKILIVDADPIIRYFLQGILAKQGYEFALAGDGNQALQLTEEFQPDLILLDSAIPAIDGFEICRRLKSNAETHDIAIIFITGVANIKNEVKALREGGFDYITKPFHPSVVIARVTNAMEMVQSRKLLEQANDEYRKLLIELRDATFFLEQRDAILKTVNCTAELFLIEQSCESGINLVLDRLSSIMESDGGYFVNLRPGGVHDAPHISHRESRADWRPSYHVLADMKNISSDLSLGKMVMGWVRDLDKKEAALLSGLGIEYYLLVPVFSARRHLGNLGFDWRKKKIECPQVILEAISTIADAMGVALQQTLTGRERDRLAKAIRRLDDAVFMVNWSGKIFYANPASENVTGYPVPELIGRQMCDILSDEACEVYKKALTDIGDKRIWQGEMRNRRKDGTVYDEEVKIIPVHDEEQQVDNYIIIKKDVTAQHRLQSIAEATSLVDNVGIVFSTIRHELGNPLNSLQIVLSTLIRDIDRLPTGQVTGFLERSLAEVERMKELLYSLKNFNFHDEMILEPVQMADYLKHFLRIYNSDLKKHGIEVKFPERKSGIIAIIDKRAFHQVLLNLLTNAMAALQDMEDPLITFNCQPVAGELIEMIFTDNGPGFSLEVEKHMFQPFYTTKTEGTGLGLIIVKKLLTAMNGSLTLKNSKSGGVIATISLPAGNAIQ